MLASVVHGVSPAPTVLSLVLLRQDSLDHVNNSIARNGLVHQAIFVV